MVHVYDFVCLMICVFTYALSELYASLGAVRLLEFVMMMIGLYPFNGLILLNQHKYIQKFRDSQGNSHEPSQEKVIPR